MRLPWQDPDACKHVEQAGRSHRLLFCLPASWHIHAVQEGGNDLEVPSVPPAEAL